MPTNPRNTTHTLSLSRPHAQFFVISPFHFSLPSLETTKSGHQFMTPPPPIEPAPQYDQNPSPAPPCTYSCLYTQPSNPRCCCSLTFIDFRPPSRNTSTTALIHLQFFNHLELK
ncbi:hypothetical protein RchiOBHm_Chr3g0472761 [Rosa chinensis]|uniref:Uncharacterized protein n=1 Tax=Rosa chinensis TaxID=74649 RepID=A0A2P6RBN3_ROSCH|nr:hypothetical protein RchiOBHm_Chr3g0472761 [Rosa chinensis]